IDVLETPLFPFGHGLSYTTFGYADLRPSSTAIRAGDSLGVSVSVTNTGSREGTEVVQLYLRHDAASVTRPVRELKRFERVTLRPGESRTVRFTLRADDMSFYDLDLRKVVEPGAITLFAGGSSAATLDAHVTLSGETRVLAPPPPRLH